jgi:hydrogenase maturation protease
MTGPGAAHHRAVAQVTGTETGTTGRMLIAGVGNIFLGDDGFGPEVAKRLATAGLPGWARVADYGISGMHLAYDLADGYAAAILIDAAPRGGKPGTLTILDVTAEHRRDPAAAGGPLGASRLFDAHGMQPDVVLGVLEMLGADGGTRILVVGCEPASVDYRMELSEPVAKAVDEAARVVLDLVAEFGRGRQDDPAPDSPEIPETTGEGVSHVPWHSR